MPGTLTLGCARLRRQGCVPGTDPVFSLFEPPCMGVRRRIGYEFGRGHSLVHRAGRPSLRGMQEMMG